MKPITHIHTVTLSFSEVCEQYAISEEHLVTWIEHGLFPPPSMDIKSIAFDSAMIEKLQTAQRLHDDLHINPPGVTLALELLDEIQSLRHQIHILEKINGIKFD